MISTSELSNQFETKMQLLCIAREQLFNITEDVIRANETLASAEAAAMNSGKINGKNEEIRKAQIADFCHDELIQLRRVKELERRARYEFEQAQSNLDLTRYLLRVLEVSAHL